MQWNRKNLTIINVHTLQYRIVVHVRLFILRENVALYGLIWSCMIIEFENYFTKTDNFGYFSLFLRKITACTVLLDPVCLFKIAISSPCMLISSCTTIRYCRVISFEWVTPSDPAGRHVVFFLFANKTNRQIDMSRGDYLTKPYFHEFPEFFRFQFPEDWNKILAAIIHQTIINYLGLQGVSFERRCLVSDLKY